MKKKINPNRFTAYKQSIDGNATRRDFIRNLNAAELHALPLGPQRDNVGEYVWAYGLNDGEKI